jgi:Spy/CpxP family protein refolding chaperone
MSRILFHTSFALALALLVSPASAQPGGGRGFGGGMGDLLRSAEVQDEIELVDEQKEELQAVGEEIRDQMRSMFEGMRDLGPDERRERFENMREEMQEVRDTVEGRIKEVLMPEQFERLEQITMQQQIRRSGLSGALQGSVAESLGITDEQREKMVTRAQELQAEMQAKIAQIRQEAQDELKQMLTPEQRSKLEELIGDDFEMPERDFRGGRDRGQRGGDRGGRDRGRPQSDE